MPASQEMRLTVRIRAACVAPHPCGHGATAPAPLPLPTPPLPLEAARASIRALVLATSSAVPATFFAIDAALRRSGSVEHRHRRRSKRQRCRCTLAALPLQALPLRLQAACVRLFSPTLPLRDAPEASKTRNGRGKSGTDAVPHPHPRRFERFHCDFKRHACDFFRQRCRFARLRKRRGRVREEEKAAPLSPLPRAGVVVAQRAAGQGQRATP